jgi:hypothetical protein
MMEETQGEGSPVSVPASDDTPEYTQTGFNALTASKEWVEQIVAAADGDDTVLLQLTREHLEVCKIHADAIRELRAAAIVRERDRGKSNRELRDVAGISDSQVARTAIGAGGKRRIDRRRGPAERRQGPPDRRSDGSS